MSNKTIRTVRRIVICLILILSCVLAWIIAMQVRESRRIEYAPSRSAAFMGLPDEYLTTTLKPACENIIDKALAEQHKAKLKKVKDKAKEKAEEGKLKKPADVEEKAESGGTPVSEGAVSWNDGWEYAQFSKIHTGSAVLYRAAANRKNVTVAVNAGHGTAGGQSVYTQCHPDGSAKVTGGSTGAGSTQAMAVSSGTALADGTSEASAVLSLAQVVRQDLLAAGFDVLMIRDGDDVQLDNVARTVMANNNADCHISLHYDSTQSDKGFFYTSVPDVPSYRSMEPVASHWQQHNAFGESILAGVRDAGVRIHGGGSMALDLTQTSYSTIPSVDLEVGDRASDHSAGTLAQISEGITAGITAFF